MIAIEQSDNHAAIVAPNLRLAFQWHVDRWVHALEVGRGPGRRLFAQSVESGPTFPDPASVVSPTFQELDVQSSAQGVEVRALLVGKAGPHHFSAAIRVFHEGSGFGRTVVHLDVADRCRAGVGALASTYRVHAPPSTIVEAGSTEVRWQPDADGPMVVLGAAESEIGSARLGLAEEGRARTQAQVEALTRPGEATQRWIYWWVVIDPHASPSSRDG